MKHLGFILITAVMLALGSAAEAKKTMAPKMYMFGIAASFNDSIVYFTNIQEVDSAWIESKNKFLLDRGNYSLQLKEFLAKKMQLPQRTCIIYYNTKRTKLEKKFIKIRQLYIRPKKRQTNRFDVRYLEEGEFTFKALDASYY